MKVGIIGCGYLGLTAAACLASKGHMVWAQDINEPRIKALQAGELPFFEPGLDEVFQVGRNYLKFTADIKHLGDCEIILLAVPTPASEDGSADVSAILNAVNSFAGIAGQGAVILNKCTSPVGTAQKLLRILAERGREDVRVVSQPEFLREGKAVADFLQPDRIVLGVGEPAAVDVVKNLYHFVDGNRFIVMDYASAELTKYAANSYLATRISFVNEMARLADKVGADIEMVTRAMGMDKRIGPDYLRAGLGYGGGCLIKDVAALSCMAQENALEMSISNAAQQVNHGQLHWFIQKIEAMMGGLKGKRFAVWGAAFKPGTSDIREAPAIKIINKILSEAGDVSLYDPKAASGLKELFTTQIDYAGNMYDAVKEADALLVITEWEEFGVADFGKVKSLMKGSAIFDGRNCLPAELLKQLGFDYSGVGKL